MIYNKPEVLVTNAVEVIAGFNKFGGGYLDLIETPPTRDFTRNAYEADE
jgi:hypothetical protein